MRTILFLYIFCFFQFTNLFSQKKYELQYKAQPHKLKYKFSTTAEGVQETAGMRIVSERFAQGLVSLQLVEETADHLTVEMVYDSLQIQAVSELGETVIKSPSEVIGMLIKKVITRNGDQLSSVEISEFGVLPAAVSFSTKNEFLTNLPDKPIFEHQTLIAVDTDTVLIATGTCLNELSLEYLFLGKEVVFGYDCVKLGVNGKAKLSGDFNRQNTQFYITGEGNIMGTILFSPEKGLLVSSSNQTKLHLSIMTTGDEPVSIPVIQTGRSEIILSH